MRTIFIVCLICMIHQVSIGQTLKIAHKSHSGSTHTFKVTKNEYHLGLPSGFKEEKKKKDSLAKVEKDTKQTELRKQDSLKNLKKSRKEKKAEKKENDKMNPVKASTAASLPSYQVVSTDMKAKQNIAAYPVAYTPETNNRSIFTIFLITILPTFLVLYAVLQKIRWM